MTSQNQRKRALLIGNGINQLDPEQSISWGALLDQIKDRFHIQADIDNAFKPFPLGFEEMLHRKRGANEFSSKLKNLKQGIRRNIDGQLQGKNGFNRFHREFMLLGYDDVLTTNYDYALQKSVQPDFEERKQALARYRMESKFSMRRSYRLDKNPTKVWHIHGELADARNLNPASKFYHEESIMIGYEHYASYLERIQDNFKGLKGTQKPENQGLMTRVRNGVSDLFWTDIFFTHNVDIVGQGMDYSENHLWWLLNQRAILMRESYENYETRITNRIRFFYPEIAQGNMIPHDATLDEIIKIRNGIEKAKGIAEVLEAFEVERHPIRCTSYEDFYEKLVNGAL